MNQRPRYVSMAPGLADQKHVNAIGKAHALFLLLVDFQYDAEGWVNYRKPINVGWIQHRFPGTKRRSIQRWLGQLRAGGYIATVQTGHGFLVRILHQKKFPTRQMSLFPSPDPVRISGGKPGGKPERYEKRDAPQVAHQIRQKCRTVS